MSRCAPRTLAISQRRSADGDDVVAWVRAIAAAGVDAIQLREKDLGGAACSSWRGARWGASGARHGPDQRSPRRRDRAGAAGVHLPANGVPLARARRRLPDRCSASPPIASTRSRRRATQAPTTSSSARCSLRPARLAAGAGGLDGLAQRRRSASRCSRSAASPSSGCPRSPRPAPPEWRRSAPSNRRSSRRVRCGRSRVSLVRRAAPRDGAVAP